MRQEAASPPLAPILDSGILREDLLSLGKSSFMAAIHDNHNNDTNNNNNNDDNDNNAVLQACQVAQAP